MLKHHATKAPRTDVVQVCAAGVIIVTLFAGCRARSAVTDDDIQAYFQSAACAEDGARAEDKKLTFLRNEAEDVGCAPPFDAYFRCRVAGGTCGDEQCGEERDAIDACGYDPQSPCNRAEEHVAACLGHFSHPKVMLCGSYMECWERCRLDATCEDLESSGVPECQSKCVDEL